MGHRQATGVACGSVPVRRLVGDFVRVEVDFRDDLENILRFDSNLLKSLDEMLCEAVQFSATDGKRVMNL